MRKIIIRGDRHIHPFNEEARDLRIQNKPLWLHQRDTLARYTTQEIEVPGFDFIPQDDVESLVHRDNLYFDQAYIDAFLTAAKKLGGPCRAPLPPDNNTFFPHPPPPRTSHTQ